MIRWKKKLHLHYSPINL